MTCQVVQTQAVKCPFYSEKKCLRSPNNACYITYYRGCRLMSQVIMPDGTITYVPKGYHKD